MDDGKRREGRNTMKGGWGAYRDMWILPKSWKLGEKGNWPTSVGRRRCGWFLLSAEALCTVKAQWTLSQQIPNTALRGKRVRILRASAHNIFLTPSIHDLVLCEFLLKERGLMGSIVDSFALNLGPTAQWLIPVQASPSNSYICLCKPWWTSLELTLARQPCSTTLSLNRETTTKNYKSAKNMALSLPEGTPFSWYENWKQDNVALLDATRKAHGSWRKFFVALHMSVTECKGFTSLEEKVINKC